MKTYIQLDGNIAELKDRVPPPVKVQTIQTQRLGVEDLEPRQAISDGILDEARRHRRAAKGVEEGRHGEGGVLWEARGRQRVSVL